MHACTVSIVVPSCFVFLCVSYLSNVFSFLLQPVFFSTSIGMSMLGSCPLWTCFEQVTWGTRFYPNKGSLGHLLQHENSSTDLNKRRLIDLKPSGLLQIYLSFSWSIFLTTYRYMSILRSFYRPIYLLSTCTILPFLLSLYKSIYLYCLCLLSICLSSYLSNLSI